MSFLSSLAKSASAAAASVSSMVSGSNLPFETGAEYTSVRDKMPWKMHAGTKEHHGDVSIFLYNIKEAKSPAELAQVRNAMKKLRTIKHPYLLRCIDAGEIPDNKGGGTIYVVTEPVQPLCEVIESLQATPGGIAWGIYTVAAAVKFLNIDCNIVHGQVCMPSLFVDKGMDWKLGGFELLTEAAAADEAYFGAAKDTLPRFYQSPELGRDGDALEDVDTLCGMAMPGWLSTVTGTPNKSCKAWKSVRRLFIDVAAAAADEIALEPTR